MKTKELGSQGLEIPALGLGCMGMTTFAGADTYGKADEKEAIATIHRSFELGGNFLDTADMYGPFLNERLVAKAIEDKRDQYILATKFGFEIDDEGQVAPNWKINGTPEYVKKSIERSLKNLKTDYIDLYYLHRPDPYVPIEETVGAMADLVSEGKVKYIGISEVTADQIKKAHEEHPITAVQNEFSIFERDAEVNGVLATTRELGIGLVAYSPLGRGFLTGQIRTPDDLPEDDFRRAIPRFQGEQFYKNIELVDKIGEIAAQKDATPPQLALAWILAKEVTPIPGTKRVKYVEQNIEAASIELTAEEIEQLETIVPLDMETGDRNPQL